MGYALTQGLLMSALRGGGDRPTTRRHEAAGDGSTGLAPDQQLEFHFSATAIREVLGAVYPLQTVLAGHPEPTSGVPPVRCSIA
jgi:hypothetical protein